MSHHERSIMKYSNLFGRIGRIFYDEVSLCILDAIIKLYFKHFIFELNELVEITSLEKDIVRRSLYSFRGTPAPDIRRQAGQNRVLITSEIFEIENDKTGIREHVLANFDIKKKYDINNRLEFWKLNSNIKGRLTRRAAQPTRQHSPQNRPRLQEFRHLHQNLHEQVLRARIHIRTVLRPQRVLQLRNRSAPEKRGKSDEVQEDTRQRFQNKREAEALIAELADFVDSLEHVKFPTSGKPDKEAEEEVEVDDKLAKLHDSDSRYVQFKESFFKTSTSRKGDFFLDSLKNISQDSPIIRFYKTMNFREIIDRELGVCPRETKIKEVARQVIEGAGQTGPIGLIRPNYLICLNSFRKRM